jgi:type II secretory pathway component PulC
LLAGHNACGLAEVAEIRADSVLLSNLLTNRLEVLTFAGGEPSASAATAPPAPVVSASANTVAVGLGQGSVDYYLKNLSELLDAAFATPRMRDGADGRRVIDGYEIGRIREGSIVEQLGIRNGDVLLEVNGQALDGLPTILKLLGQAQTTPQVKMTVLRKNQRLTFVLSGK